MNSNSTQRFSDRVENYVRYRPGYPDAVVSILAEQFSWSGPQTVADVGSGTGFSSELFLRLGHSVIGIEPNQPMREAGKMYLAVYDRSGRFQSVEGTAEATTLADDSVDGVVAGQAFHWFNPERARTEFCRITKPNGWGALVWNSRKTDSSPFLRAYEALLREFGTDYAAIRHEDIATEIFEQFFGTGYIRHVLPNVQRFDLAGVTGRLLSSSYAPAAGHPRHEPMLAALATIFQEHACDGVVEFEYDTEIFAGRLC